jgi:hypothetical protein
MAKQWVRFVVIPAKAGIQIAAGLKMMIFDLLGVRINNGLDPRFRGDDESKECM